ncbi:hypothetical protein [Mycobacteroides abscessus]|uniref:hypothetical protein n=1 Tax=Mycobacteroides abscessus TaxID=36809 RepID=UPI00105497E0|nr:hypothetical protein [Mycobacteroides abscessus]
MSSEQGKGVVTVTPHRVRFDTCASCRAAAEWAVSGPQLGYTTTCARHLPTWKRRAEFGK